jgi:hypothetical protein
MLGALASAALIVAASLTVGQAALTLCGRRDDRALAGPVGLAILLAVAAIVAGLEGRGLAIAIALVGVTAAGAGVLVRVGLPRVARSERMAAIVASLLAGLVAALPFIAAGAVGILGVGLVNDDMASHLLLADWLEERFRPEPVLIDQGYPLGPHALVAGLGEILGARTIDVFAGLVLALPGLTAFAVAAYLRELRTAVRIGVAVVASLPYLASAYLAQEAFKEPMLALFVLAFALLLPGSRSPRRAIPLGVLAAGTIYVYSFPGLAWLIGAALVWGAIELARGRRPHRSAWIAAAAGVGALAVVAAPEIGRLLDFADFRALDPDRANEGGLGNLRGHISPLEALGIWPTSEFRLSIAASSVPAVVFYACGLLGLVAFGLALPRWLRRYGTAIPAAIVTAVVLYVAARAFGTVYTSAKALAIAAPLITLVTLGGLLTGAREGPRFRFARALPALAAVVAVGSIASSFLILRQAPVAPEAHAEELEEIRPLVEGEKLLFLGRDNFILWELRGSRPFVAVRNYYNPLYVKPNTALADVFSKFDFDSVTGEDLARFPYVLTTNAAYQSSPPPGYELLHETESYRLWARGAVDPSARRPGEDDAAPGAEGGCPPGERVAVVASLARTPLVAADWSRATIEDGEPATLTLDLPAGGWELSIQYDSTRPLTISADGESATLPGNLDYRGSTPFWRTGMVLRGHGPVEISAEVSEPPLAGRLLGANSVAHLGALAATERGRDPGPRRSGCDAYVDWYEPAPGRARQLSR